MSVDSAQQLGTLEAMASMYNTIAKGRGASAYYVRATASIPSRKY